MVYAGYKTMRRSYRIGKRLVKGTASVARKAFSLAKSLKEKLNVEYKYFDSSITNTSIGDTGQTGYLTAIPAGTGASERTGKGIHVKSLYMRYTLKHNTAITNSQMRLIIYQSNDKTPNVTVTNVLQNARITSPLNKDFARDLHVLYDKVFQMDVYKTDQAQGKCYIKFRGNRGKVYYSGTASTDYAKGQLCYLLLSDINAANYPSATFDCRVNYVDN